MDCSETRLEIEKIEDLKNPGHKLPPEVVSHLEQCEGCSAYHKASCKLENHLFSEIRNVTPPESGADRILKSTYGFRFRAVHLWLAGAAALLVLFPMLFLLPGSHSDITVKIVNSFLDHTISFDRIYAEEADNVLQEFRDCTGTCVCLPCEVTPDQIITGQVLLIDSTYTCAFKCSNQEESFTFFIFKTDNKPWECCGKEKCTCLSNDTISAVRWKHNGTGYLIIREE